jgi:transcriptional regulator with XRE-family HTH domain
MITGKQIRVARKSIGWSQEDLATAAAVSVSAISDLESEKSKPHKDTVDLVRKALANAGVELPQSVADSPQAAKGKPI